MRQAVPDRPARFSQAGLPQGGQRVARSRGGSVRLARWWDATRLPTSSPCELVTRLGGRVVAVDGMRGQVLAVAAELLQRSGEAHRLPSGRVGAETTEGRIRVPVWGNRKRPGRSVTCGREVHVVLRRSGPGAAPAPADRAECAYDCRCDHPAAKPRAIHVAGALPVACPLHTRRTGSPAGSGRSPDRTRGSTSSPYRSLPSREKARPGDIRTSRSRPRRPGARPPAHTSRRDACGGSGTAGGRAFGRHRGDRQRTRGPRRAGRNAPRRQTPSG